MRQFHLPSLRSLQHNYVRTTGVIAWQLVTEFNIIIVTEINIIIISPSTFHMSKQFQLTAGILAGSIGRSDVKNVEMNTHAVAITPGLGSAVSGAG